MSNLISVRVNPNSKAIDISENRAGIIFNSSLMEAKRLSFWDSLGEPFRWIFKGQTKGQAIERVFKDVHSCCEVNVMSTQAFMSKVDKKNGEVIFDVAGNKFYQYVNGEVKELKFRSIPQEKKDSLIQEVQQNPTIRNDRLIELFDDYHIDIQMQINQKLENLNDTIQDEKVSSILKFSAFVKMRNLAVPTAEKLFIVKFISSKIEFNIDTYTIYTGRVTHADQEIIKKFLNDKKGYIESDASDEKIQVEYNQYYLNLLNKEVNEGKIKNLYGLTQHEGFKKCSVEHQNQVQKNFLEKNAKFANTIKKLFYKRALDQPLLVDKLKKEINENKINSLNDLKQNVDFRKCYKDAQTEIMIQFFTKKNKVTIIQQQVKQFLGDKKKLAEVKDQIQQHKFKSEDDFRKEINNHSTLLQPKISEFYTEYCANQLSIVKNICDHIEEYNKLDNNALEQDGNFKLLSPLRKVEIINKITEYNANQSIFLENLKRLIATHQFINEEFLIENVEYKELSKDNRVIIQDIFNREYIKGQNALKDLFTLDYAYVGKFKNLSTLKNDEKFKELSPINQEIISQNKQIEKFFENQEEYFKICTRLISKHQFDPINDGIDLPLSVYTKTSIMEYYTGHIKGQDKIINDTLEKHANRNFVISGDWNKSLKLILSPTKYLELECKIKEYDTKWQKIRQRFNDSTFFNFSKINLEQALNQESKELNLSNEDIRIILEKYETHHMEHQETVNNYIQKQRVFYSTTMENIEKLDWYKRLPKRWQDNIKIQYKAYVVEQYKLLKKLPEEFSKIRDLGDMDSKYVGQLSAASQMSMVEEFDQRLQLVEKYKTHIKSGVYGKDYKLLEQELSNAVNFHQLSHLQCDDIKGELKKFTDSTAVLINMIKDHFKIKDGQTNIIIDKSQITPFDALKSKVSETKINNQLFGSSKQFEVTSLENRLYSSSWRERIIFEYFKNEATFRLPDNTPITIKSEELQCNFINKTEEHIGKATDFTMHISVPVVFNNNGHVAMIKLHVEIPMTIKFTDNKSYMPKEYTLNLDNNSIKYDFDTIK